MGRIVATGFLLIVPSFVLAADDVKDEMKKLEGPWNVATAEIDGKTYSARQFGVTRVLIAGGKLTFQDDGKDVKTFTFTVDPSKKPKAMDLVNVKDSMSLPAIYALDGDESKLGMPLIPTKVDKVELKRPESFVTKDIPVLTMTLKREKK
jgi:uncharacterized protein (TIGR03067 family)